MDSVGPYRLDVLLGRGTTGAVWRAVRGGPIPQVVAVKRARVASGATDADRLRNEAAVLAELDHPHIVRVLDVLVDGDDVAIVMSLARGGSLHDLLEERGRLTAGQVVAVLSRVADALGSAHRRGVLHGDVKPANVLFTSDGEPLLGDFGVAQHLLPGVAGHRAVEGTAGYVDPELVATGRPEPRNDIYGMGALAYLCLSGHLPHGETDTETILAAAERGEHRPLTEDSTIPPGLAAVVDACLARDPARRPPTSEALAQALRGSVDPREIVLPGVALGSTDDGPDSPAALAGLAADQDGGEGGENPRATRAFGPRPPQPTEDQARRRPLLSGLVVLALLGGAAAGGLWIRSRLDAEQVPQDVTAPAVRTARGKACPDLPTLEVPPGATELEADFRGAGCAVQVVWDGQVMAFRLSTDDDEPRRYDFGGRRGQLLVGDWNCDGAESPALYETSTGRVLYFPYVPEGARAEIPPVKSESSGIVDGEASVSTGEDDCDVVGVKPSA